MSSFDNHKCYMVEKQTMKNATFGVENYAPSRLVDIGQVRECALIAKSTRP